MRTGQSELANRHIQHFISGKFWRRQEAYVTRVLNSVDRRHRAVTRLRAELSPFVCNQSASERRYANCRSGPRLQKVEPVPILKLLLSRLDELVARVSKKASKLGMDLSKRNYGVLESRANLIF